uniref:Protein phosphatase inhibitor 2 n=1 Tax=Lygus hesperus TaxID=30085 RepID=A0A0A9XDM7_LYGHE
MDDQLQRPTNVARKSILKPENEAEKERRKTMEKRAHFDEENIKVTLHPEDKDYGFMKIPECNTPFERNRPSDAGPIDPDELAKRLAEVELTEEEIKAREARRKSFESKKKAHYFQEFKKPPPAEE